jgi:hypothetical protein
MTKKLSMFSLHDDLQSSAHSGHASVILVSYAFRQALHSIFTWGTSPYFSFISSGDKWDTALHPHWGQEVCIRYVFLLILCLHKMSAEIGTDGALIDPKLKYSFGSNDCQPIVEGSKNPVWIQTGFFHFPMEIGMIYKPNSARSGPK